MNVFTAIRDFDQLDHKAMLQSIAEDNLAAFVAAGDSLDWPMIPPIPAYMLELVHLLNKPAKVEAIKLVRTNTGMGLKEAKDAVDLVTNCPNLSEHIQPCSRDWADEFIAAGLKFKLKLAPVRVASPHVDNMLFRLKQCLNPGEERTVNVYYIQYLSGGEPRIYASYFDPDEAERVEADLLRDPDYPGVQMHTSYPSLKREL